MPRIRKPIGPFPGGVNLTDPPGGIDPSELATCMNIRLDPNGFPYKRPGHRKFSANTVNGTTKPNFGWRYYKGDGTKQLVVASGGRLFLINDVTGVPTQIDINGSVGQNMGASALCWGLVVKDRLYILDGTKPQRYNGTVDPYAGFYSQAAPTGVQNTSGQLTQLGTYKYAVASVQGDLGEGPLGAILTVTLTGSNDGVNLSVIEDAPAMHGQTAKRIYRTKANLTQFHFLAEIPFGTTTYNDVTIGDNSLGTAHTAVSNPPATAKYAVLGHDQRVYWFGVGTEPSTVYTSDVGFPDRIVDSDFFTVANNDGDFLMGGARVPGGIVFFKRKSLWLLRGFGFGLINISTVVGTIAPWSICEVPSGVIFVSQEGKVYHFDGTNLEEIGYKIKVEFYGLGETSWLNMISCYHEDRYILSYDRRNSRGYNHRQLEYSLMNKHWLGPHENANKLTAGFFISYDSFKDRGQLFWTEANGAIGGYIYYRDEFQKEDDGTRAVAIWKTGHRILPGRHRKKVFKVHAKGKMTTDTRLSVSVVGEDGVSKTTAEFSTNSLGIIDVLVWNSGKWGIHASSGKKWAGSSVNVGEASLGIGASGSALQLEFTDSGTSKSFSLEEVEALVSELLLR